MNVFLRGMRIAFAIVLGILAALLALLALLARSDFPTGLLVTTGVFSAGAGAASYVLWPPGVGKAGSYLSRTLQEGERIEMMARLHWIMFVRPGFLIAVGAWVAFAGAQTWWMVIGIIVAIVACLRLMVVAIEWWTTEIAVTDRRVLLKVGLISRDTVEINAAKIESVDVRQPLLGRVLNYGTIVVRGTGGNTNKLTDVLDPLTVRKAIARV